MSILSPYEVVPSRVSAVFRYLLQQRDYSEMRDRLELMLSPEPLRGTGEGNMVTRVLNDCINMGLIAETGRDRDASIAIPPATMQRYGHPRFVDSAFRDLLLGLITNTNNQHNHQPCRVLAWLMRQDTLTFRGDATGMLQSLVNQTGEERLHVTNIDILNNLHYWSIYLGLAVKMKAFRSGEAYLILPDPTEAVGRWLPELLPPGDIIPVKQFLEGLAAKCPIFPEGYFWDQVSVHFDRRDGNGLPPALCQALMRLRDADKITLHIRSDAEVFYLPDGREFERCTHLQFSQTDKAETRGIKDPKESFS